ncbi:hypothetical protein PFICI_08500 [Pestalotiopsis fici W106-1]|uniref:3-carboxymuconate cyclase n=1 Tax=Pestalotiopsis fici (strain W106-1 / CGMCC3.15140) TaxID=1229662 RepID=W3WZT4_PESFW|nr:uncharacterized protein PFICI_08500 [Pestalotiopsis fici W106-1]ETS78647.1 hypothetical protein PFICI_08500 [Pestalotiopsis fici W106-1]
MSSLSRVISLASLALSVAALPYGTEESCPAPPRALYTITNDYNNSVVALPIGADGKIPGCSFGRLTSTGGSGGNTINSGKKAAPDALSSQAALTIAGNYIFAVNAGSNSVSMFSIDAQDPTKVTMIGQPAVVSGDFPVTVAASLNSSQVCVGCSGTRSGVSCASYSAEGIGAMDDLRSFELGQSMPPTGPLNTVSQIFFSTDESILYTTIKGDPSQNKTGFLAAFSVTDGQVEHDGAMTSPNGTVALFGTTQIPDSTNLFVTDAGFGSVILEVDGTGAATLQDKVEIQGQKATCWSTISPATNTAFVTDVALNRLVEQSLTDASIVAEIDLAANGDPGLTDLQAGGKFIYALSPGNGTTQAAIAVVDATTKRQVQHFGLQMSGVSKNAQGIALLL